MRKHYTEDQRSSLVALVTTGRATPRAAAAACTARWSPRGSVTRGRAASQEHAEYVSEV
jgi:hypothetical protein